MGGKRFARFNMSKDHSILVDATEYTFPIRTILELENSALDAYLASLSAPDVDEDALDRFVVYGKFLPNRKLPMEDAAEYVHRAAGYVLSSFRWTTPEQRSLASVGLLDVVTLEVPERKLVAFAALVAAEDESILVDGGAGVSYFQSLEGLDPFTCLLNRPGIFFLKRVVARVQPDRQDSWKQHVYQRALLKSVAHIF